MEDLAIVDMREETDPTGSFKWVEYTFGDGSFYAWCGLSDEEPESAEQISNYADVMVKEAGSA